MLAPFTTTAGSLSARETSHGRSLLLHFVFLFLPLLLSVLSVPERDLDICPMPSRFIWYWLACRHTQYVVLDVLAGVPAVWRRTDASCVCIPSLAFLPLILHRPGKSGVRILRTGSCP